MVRNHLVKFKASKEEKELIRQRAAALGYSSVGAYLRDISLHFDFHEKINAIYDKLNQKA